MRIAVTPFFFELLDDVLLVAPAEDQRGSRALILGLGLGRHAGLPAVSLTLGDQRRSS